MSGGLGSWGIQDRQCCFMYSGYSPRGLVPSAPVCGGVAWHGLAGDKQMSTDQSHYHRSSASLHSWVKPSLTVLGDGRWFAISGYPIPWRIIMKHMDTKDESLRTHVSHLVLQKCQTTSMTVWRISRPCRATWWVPYHSSGTRTSFRIHVKIDSRERLWMVGEH